MAAEAIRFRRMRGFGGAVASSLVATEARGIVRGAKFVGNCGRRAATGQNGHKEDRTN